MAKLLVADDLVPIRQMVRITLSTQGWTIVEAKNGNEALELVRSEKPDLVLLDVDMGPGPNGFDVCRQIKADEATKDIPVVMLTAHESDSDRAIGFAAGATQYLTKPFGPLDPEVPEATGGDVFRQLLHQAVRVADMASSQAMRMALDFAKVYEREQGVRKDFESQLKQMTLMEKQATRYAEDLAAMLRSERERRQELERALEQERIASEELRRTGLQGISHLVLAATIKDRTTGTHLQRVRRYVEAIAERLGLPGDLVEEFGYSSVMHDVGKIHTPDHILQSEHHLSDAEFSVIKQHCIDGEKMLGTARFFETARGIAR